MLKDSFGRTVNYLRLSVTDRCDFRCIYCMAEEMQFVPREQLLSIEEITQISHAFIELGVRKIRLTGGEPLIRKNISQLIENLGNIDNLDELTLTTNASQLPKYSQNLVNARVKRINVSLDSLKTQRFKSLTRTGDLNLVLKGIDSAINAGIKVKLNSVILRHRNLDEVTELVNFAMDKNCDISFIEEMPLGHIDEHQRQEEFVSSAELRDIISRHYALTEQVHTDITSGPSRYWKIENSKNKIGFISPHSDNFCHSCNRVRLTATGKLLLCLGNENSVDLLTVIRQHPNDRKRLKQTILDAMQIKPERHYFDLNEAPQIVRFMNTTGG